MSAEPFDHGIDPGATADASAAAAGRAILVGDSPRLFTEGPGTQIGPYKLLQKIGEGGMGAVYMAEQEEPVRRKLALKIIKPGMDSDQVVARFEAERQALAILDHQNIAKVFDAGTTDSGRPYFVMELVKGIPINEYRDRNHLAPHERLQLFIPACQAIQHAHQKGIIHRDIKPSNVMVAIYDGKPVPKVIDFGVAKAIDQHLTERTMFTQLGAVVGTLEYMSPEQAEMTGLDVDTRSDVYSLGVLLYELLTGSTPLERARLRESGYAEILRRIREEEPPKPSTRLSESKELLPSISALRKTEPAHLARLVRGELDWIVMKALEKDRVRRYATASDLARDVERYLHDEPVEAGPPSAAYKLRKLARKYRGALVTAGSFAVLLLLATATSTYLAAQANRAEASARRAAAAAEKARQAEALERQTAENERNRAVKAEQTARAQEAKTKQSESEAKAVLEFFQSKVLAAARPLGQEGGLGKDVSLRAAVDAAQAAIGKAFADQPGVEAAVRDTLGEGYHYLGEQARAIKEFERAVELRKKALGPDHPDTLHSMNNLAHGYQYASRVAEAIALHGQTLKVMKAKLGEDAAETLISMGNLASSFQAAGRLGDAIPLMRETLERMTAKLGPDDPRTVATMNNLAWAYQEAGRIALALPLYEESVRRCRAKLGADHPETLIAINNLAWAYRGAGRLPEAIPLIEQTLEIRRARLGTDHPNTLQSMADLAVAYQDSGRLAEAVTLHEETLKGRRAKLGPDHVETLTTLSYLASSYHDIGRKAEAVALAEQAAGLFKSRLGPRHPYTLQALSNLARFYLIDRPTQAEALFREVLAAREETMPDDWRAFDSRAQLGHALFARKNYAQAEPLLLAGYEGMKSREGKIPAPARKRLTETAAWLVELYDACGKKDKADEWRRRLGTATKP